MIMQEQDNNTFTKEKTDVEKYLMRIIQRYFDTENNYSKASIESIIVESLTRFKRFCKNKGKGFLFSFNKETGHIHVDIDSFEGEPAFAKRSAFNRDFGDQIDTICEGDDARLSDPRAATEHRHESLDVTGLADALKQFVIPDYVHSHKNHSILDVLEYTGTALEIDLIVLEHINRQLPMYQTNTASISAGLTTHHNQQVADLNSSVLAFKEFVDSITSTVLIGATWVREARNTINSGVQSLQDYALRRFAKLLSQEEQQEVEEKLARTYSFVVTGSFDIATTIDGIKHITDNGRSFAVYNITSGTVPLSGVDPDSLIRLYFQYQNDDGNTVKMPFPVVFQDSFGNDIVIQCGIQNNAVVYRTLANARFEGKGVFDSNYNDGKTFILRTLQTPLSFYSAWDAALEKGYQFVDYDPANTVQQTMIQSIAGTDALYTGVCFDDETQAYVHIQRDTCHVTATENGQEGIVYYQNGKIYDCLHIEPHEQLFEIPVPQLADYYKNPQIYYEVFKKGV